MAEKKRGYEIEDAPEGQTLVLTSKWAPEAEDVLWSGRVDGLILNYARGFSEPNLEFLEGWPLRRLRVLDRSLRDLAPISRLGASLKELSVQAAPNAHLDLGALPHLETVSGEWGLLRSTLDCVESLRNLVTWRFAEPDLLALANQEGLERLTIKEARRLETLRGVGALESLQLLGVHLARRLSDIEEVSELSGLRELRFEECPGIDAIDELGVLVHLRELWVADCGQIESLGVLRAMPELERFAAWGTTRIMDGDLSPLEALPKLREVRMRARREYRPALEEIQRSLAGAQ